MKYTCPVCGYDQLNVPPANYTICPCCRTEFGVSDEFWTPDQLREDWIERGAHWGSRYVPEPPYWSVISQLKNINYTCTVHDLRYIARDRPHAHSQMIFNDHLLKSASQPVTVGSSGVSFSYNKNMQQCRYKIHG